MTSQYLVAQAYASTDPTVGQVLHALSRLKGRCDAIEAAIVEGDQRARAKALLELFEVVDEIANINSQQRAA